MEIKLSIALPDFKPDSIRKMGNKVVESRYAKDQHEQMLPPNSNRDYETHTVKKGEDWFDIGEQYDVPGTELEEFNKQFSSTPLYEGREIKIPRHFIKK